jgi:hypothetical protein
LPAPGLDFQGRPERPLRVAASTAGSIERGDEPVTAELIDVSAVTKHRVTGDFAEPPIVGELGDEKGYRPPLVFSLDATTAASAEGPWWRASTV